MMGITKPVSRRGASSRAKIATVSSDESGDKRKRSFPFSSCLSENNWPLRIVAFGLIAAAFVALMQKSDDEKDIAFMNIRGTQDAIKAEAPAIKVGQPNAELCGRKVSLDLSSVKYAAPQKLKPNGKVILLGNEKSMYGDFGAQLSSFFHAYDLAQNEKAKLALTYDSWVFRTLSPLWLGLPESIQTSPEWRNKVETIFNVAIVKDEASLPKGSKVTKQKNNYLFFFRAVTSPDGAKNHREAILRRLFLHISQGADDVDNACAAVNEIRTKGKDSTSKGNKNPYSVIHISKAALGGSASKWTKLGNADPLPAFNMSPAYVKSILGKEGMLDKKIYAVILEQDNEVEKQLKADKSLSKKLTWILSDPSHMGSAIMLAVLADIYLGNPLDHISMWIARMRYALGMKNTYVLTKEEGNEWVSYMDEEHSHLYDSSKIGPWMG